MSERTVRQKAMYYLKSLRCKLIALEHGDGWPDILVVPYKREMFFIEFKSGRKGHGLQPNQISCKHSIIDRGHKYFVVDDWDDAAKKVFKSMCNES